MYRSMMEKVEICRTCSSYGRFLSIRQFRISYLFNMRSFASAALLAATTALAQDSQDFSNRGNFGAPVRPFNSNERRRY